MNKDEVTNPHDRFFKAVLSREDQAREFLLNYLPKEIRKHIDLDSLSIIKESFIEKELKEYFSDLLYRVEIEGNPGYVYILFEHKSYPDKLTAFQLLRYMVKIWEVELKKEGAGHILPIIIPLVIYHGRSKWNIEPKFSYYFDITDPALGAYIPEFKYRVHDISHMEDDDIKGAVILRVTLLTLKYIFKPELRGKLRGIFSLLKELSDKRTGIEYLETLLRYLVHATDEVKEEDLKEAVNEIDEGGDIMPTIAEKWMQEGFEKGYNKAMVIAEQWKTEGIQQGKKEGKQEGLLKAIRLGLELKFGVEGLKLYPEIRKIKDVDMLETISDAIKSARSIEEIRKIYKM